MKPLESGQKNTPGGEHTWNQEENFRRRGGGSSLESRHVPFCVNFARDFSGEMLSLEIQLGVREPTGI